MRPRATETLPEAVALPDAVARIPGMTTWQERRCLYDAARGCDPVGHMVDVGSWFGSLTASLAAGMRANPRIRPRSTRVFAYDTYRWHSWMNPIAEPRGVTGFAHGESFLPAFRDATREWQSDIEVREGDVASFAWEDGPIAILAIDAMKNEAMTKAIMTTFFPSLVPGSSLIFQQDFAHFYTSWIHLIWWRIRDHLELVEDVPASSGSLFRYRRAIPRTRYEAILDIGKAGDEEWKKAFDHSLSLVAPDKRHMVAAAEVMRFLHAGRGRDASDAATRHRQGGIWGPELDLVVEGGAWKALVGAA